MNDGVVIGKLGDKITIDLKVNFVELVNHVCGDSNVGECDAGVDCNGG